MAKSNTIQVKMVRSADPGYFYVKFNNPKTKTEKLELKKKVVPNNKMYIKTKMLKYNRGIAKCSANCSIDDQIMSSSSFTILLPDEIKKFTKKNAN